MPPSSPKTETKDLLRNKRATYDFRILERLEAGIALCGTEVKSCRSRDVSFADSFVRFVNHEAMLVNLHIAPYEPGSQFNHDPRRPRRLLLHRREIFRLARATKELGATVIPLSLYLKGGRIKIEIALAKGKTKGDRRQDLRRHEDERETRRAVRR